MAKKKVTVADLKETIKHQEIIITTSHNRLIKCQQQKTLYGINTAPAILREIAQLKAIIPPEDAELERLQTKLKKLQAESTSP